MSSSLIGTSVLFRDLRRDYPSIVRAEGIYLYDSAGRQYIDASGGSAAVTNIGHGVREVIDAAVAQLNAFAFVPMHAFAHAPLIQLAELIASIVPMPRSRVWFVSGGSEAVENAIKLARQYHIERGHAGKHKIVSRLQSFHGATLATLGFSGHVQRRRHYVPLFHESAKIPPAYCYRCPYGLTFPECGIACARALEEAILAEGPENVAAFIAEPVVGATLGAVPAPDGYFALVREICDRYDVLFIADEVMTGFGRTGSLFGIQHSGVLPDIVAVAKGIAGGYAPLGAVIARREVIEPFESNLSNFVAGHTYSGHPVSCAIGISVISYLLKNELVENAQVQGDRLRQRLLGLQERYEIIGDVRGTGLFLGMEFVRDRRSREAFPAASGLAALVANRCLDQGLVVYPGTGTVDGWRGDHVLLAPPLTVTSQEVDGIVSRLDAALESVVKELVDGSEHSEE